MSRLLQAVSNFNTLYAAMSLPLDELEKRCPRIMTRTGKRADENNGTSGLRLAVQICPAAPKNPVAPAVTGFLLC